MKLQHQFRIITQTATSTLTQLPYRNYAIELSLTGQQPTLYLYLIRQLLLLRLCMCVYICLPVQMCVHLFVQMCVHLFADWFNNWPISKSESGEWRTDRRPFSELVHCRIVDLRSTVWTVRTLSLRLVYCLMADWTSTVWTVRTA